MLTVTRCFDGKRRASKLSDGKIAVHELGHQVVAEYVEWPSAQDVVTVLREIEDTTADIERLAEIIGS